MPEKTPEVREKIAKDIGSFIIDRFGQESPISAPEIIMILSYAFYETVDSMPNLPKGLGVEAAIDALNFFKEKYGQTPNRTKS